MIRPETEKIMIKSMTGFGRGEFTDEKRTVVVEIKAVNHRYCDIFVRMPRRYSYAEERIKNAIKEKVLRGKIEVSVVVDNFGESENEVRLNEDAAKQYYDALKALEDKLDLEGEKGITLSLIAGMPDVIKNVPTVEDEDEMIGLLLKPTAAAVDALLGMRETEGRKLAEDILHRADLIEGIKDKIKTRAPMLEKEYAGKLKARVEELLGGSVEIPEERIAVEAAIFADKANITEEVVRLESHIAQLRQMVNESGDSTGKKMDFLVQEVNREANTIGSKSNDTELTSYMLDLKAEIEKIREQVQNIE
jgi:uncharacterized protein (TIGR00255 family)